ncbi:methyltransferase domain-containing protein [bacterium]|nr:methyltransferase domain-containing protein [bacterium]
MLDKELVKKNFKKSIITYPDNAKIQLEIAQKLASFVSGHFDNILEIGSYSGFLTKELVRKLEFKNYLALDIINSYDCIKNLDSRITFLQGDIEEIELKNKFDLIVSSSSLQWCADFKNTIKKLKSYLTPGGRLLIAIFGKKKLYQIKEVFGISLNYPDISELRGLFSPDAKIIEELKTLQFQNPREVLRHLKYTGVNSLKNNKTYLEIKESLKILSNEFQNRLTYNPLYIID